MMVLCTGYGSLAPKAPGDDPASLCSQLWFGPADFLPTMRIWQKSWGAASGYWLQLVSKAVVGSSGQASGLSLWRLPAIVMSLNWSMHHLSLHIHHYITLYVSLFPHLTRTPVTVFKDHFTIVK